MGGVEKKLLKRHSVGGNSQMSASTNNNGEKAPRERLWDIHQRKCPPPQSAHTKYAIYSPQEIPPTHKCSYHTRSLGGTLGAFGPPPQISQRTAMYVWSAVATTPPMTIY